MPRRVESHRHAFKEIFNDHLCILFKTSAWGWTLHVVGSCNSLSDGGGDAWPGGVGKLGNPGRMSGREIGESEARAPKSKSRRSASLRVIFPTTIPSLTSDQSNVLSTQPHQIMATSRCFKQ